MNAFEEFEHERKPGEGRPPVERPGAGAGPRPQGQADTSRRAAFARLDELRRSLGPVSIDLVASIRQDRER